MAKKNKKVPNSIKLLATHPTTQAIVHWIRKGNNRQVISVWESMALDADCLDDCVRVHRELNELEYDEDFVECFMNAPPVTLERVQYQESKIKEEMEP